MKGVIIVLSILNLLPPQDLSPWKVTLSQEIAGSKVKLESIEKMLSGRMMVVLDKTTKTIPYLISAGTVIDAPREKVWEIIVNFDKYKEYMPFVEESKKVTTDYENIVNTNYSLVFRVMKIPFFSIDFLLSNYLQPPRRFDWYALKGDLSKDYGFWELTPTSDKKRTIVFYSVYTESGSSFINKILKKEPVLGLGFDIALASSVVRVVKERVEGKSMEFTAGKEIPWRNIDRDTVQTLVSKGAMTVVGSGEGKCKPYVSSLISINKNREEVFNAVSDYDHYDTFMPMVEKIKTLSKKGDTAVVDYKIAFNFLLFKNRVWYRLLHTYNFPSSITWYLIKGDMDAVKGGWEFLKNSNETTLSVYNFCSNLRSIGFLMKVLLNKFPQLSTGIQVATGIVVTSAIKQWIESGKYLTVKKEKKKKKGGFDDPF